MHVKYITLSAVLNTVGERDKSGDEKAIRRRLLQSGGQVIVMQMDQASGSEDGEGR